MDVSRLEQASSEDNSRGSSHTDFVVEGEDSIVTERFDLNEIEKKNPRRQ